MKQALSTFRIFGLTLASDFKFANRLVLGAAEGLAPSDDVPDVTFTCADHPPRDVDWQAIAPAYASQSQTNNGASRAYLYRLDDCDVLRFTQLADFYLWSNRIVCHLLNPACASLVEIYFLGTVLSLFLERRGIPMLHASATVVDGQAVAFLSSNHGGKSALAATLMQAGHRLLTDDILPVEQVGGHFVGRPGYPCMRMWPDEAQHFLGHYEGLEIVHPQLDKRRVVVEPEGFGTFCAEAQPLACIYLPERRDPAEWGIAVHIVPVRPAAAVVALMRNSFTPSLVQALGLQHARFPVLADLVQQVPVRRLIYPSGFEQLPRVRTALLAELARM